MILIAGIQLHYSNQKGQTMKFTLKAMVTCLAVIGLATSALAATNSTGGSGSEPGNAQGEHPEGAHQRACRSDVKKYCQGVKPGEGRIIACLKENSAKLSPACAERLAKAPNGQGKSDEANGE
jgi:hypothetical protein